MIAYCGLTCTECPAYIATEADDAARISQIAKEWSEAYKADVRPEHVWCDGCLVDGKKCVHCGECKIRACGIERGVTNCAHCSDYACEELEKFFGMVPQAKETLDAVKAGL